MKKKLIIKLDDFFRGEVELETEMPAMQQFRLPPAKKVESESLEKRFSAPFACFDADYDFDYDYDFDWDWSWDYDWSDESYDWYDIDDSDGTVKMDGRNNFDNADNSNRGGQNEEGDWNDLLDWGDEFDPSDYDVHISGPTVTMRGGGGGGGG